MLQDHLAHGATTMPYAPPASQAPGQGPTPSPQTTLAPQVVAQFEHIELEYASLRKGVAIFDMPHRGEVIVRGHDRLDFLNRMLTQELKGVSSGQVLHSFWLNRTGRIDADLQLSILDDQVIFDLDIHAAARTCETLETFVFSEDVFFENSTQSTHRLLLAGPATLALLGAAADRSDLPDQLEDKHSTHATIAGRLVLLIRDDMPGIIRVDLRCSPADVCGVYAALVSEHQKPTARPIGWHAFNMARIEAGMPLYNLDFGSRNLPHETGVLRDRVSFTKGCYLGQEVVARMQALGHPKQQLVALRFNNETDPNLPQPVTGARLFATDDTHPPQDETSAKAVGQITSSAISPMLASVPICFAMVRHANTSPGTTLWVETHDTFIEATVQPGLVFYPTT